MVATIRLLPFTATTGDSNISIEFSFRPSVTFVASVDALATGGTIGPTVTLDVPKLAADPQYYFQLTARRPKRRPRPIKSTRISPKSYRRSD